MCSILCPGTHVVGLVQTDVDSRAVPCVRRRDRLLGGDLTETRVPFALQPEFAQSIGGGEREAGSREVDVCVSG